MHIIPPENNGFCVCVYTCAYVYVCVCYVCVCVSLLYGKHFSSCLLNEYKIIITAVGEKKTEDMCFL